MDATSFHIAKTANTPQVNWNAESGIFKMIGKLFPENIDHFFTPLKDELIKIPKEGDALKLVLHLDYLNSSSVISILDMLRFFEKGFERTIEIDWLYDQDDDEMRKLGNDFELLLETKFTYIEVKEVG